MSAMELAPDYVLAETPIRNIHMGGGPLAAQNALQKLRTYLAASELSWPECFRMKRRVL